MNDPLLNTFAILSVTLVFLGTHLINKYRPKFVFSLPVIFLSFGFPLFLLVVIIQGSPLSGYLFYAGLSLWIGGFYGIFYAWYLHVRNKRNKIK